MQAIAIHTFIVVMWGKLGHQINVAYYVVGFTWLFVILFVGISTGIHTKGSEHYMTPDGVRLHPLRLLDLTNLISFSLGAGLAMGPNTTKRNELAENTSSYWPPCSSHSLPTSHFSFGHEGTSPLIASIGGRLTSTVLQTLRETTGMVGSAEHLG